MAAWTGVAMAAPPTAALGYAVFALQRATIGARTRVGGDAGALFDTLTLGTHARVSGSAAGPTIAAGRGARAIAGFYCTTLTGGDGDTCQTLPNPLIATPTIVLVGPAGNTDVTAAKRSKSTSPLAAGTYGALTLGTASQVLLAGGAYQFESITLGARAKLLCRAACDVTVRGRVQAAQATQLGAGDGVAPASVIFRIASQGQATAFSAKSRVRVRGSIYAPGADVQLGAAANVSGSLVGNAVTVGARGRLQGGSPAT